MHKFAKAILSIILALSLNSPVFALEDIKVEQGSILSLNDCITIALNNNPNIKNAQYNYGISKANVNIARSEFFPTIGIGTGYNLGNTNTKYWKNIRLINSTTYKDWCSSKRIWQDSILCCKTKKCKCTRQYYFNRRNKRRNLH